LFARDESAVGHGEVVSQGGVVAVSGASRSFETVGEEEPLESERSCPNGFECTDVFGLELEVFAADLEHTWVGR